MTRIVLIVAGRDPVRGPVNVVCPECPRIAAPVEAALAPWCAWCGRWFCGTRCAQRHVCRARRAVHALLDRLVAA
jgi:hypothetical protein